MLAVKQGADFSLSCAGDHRSIGAEGPGPAMELYGRRGQQEHRLDSKKDLNESDEPLQMSSR